MIPKIRLEWILICFPLHFFVRSEAAFAVLAVDMLLRSDGTTPMPNPHPHWDWHYSVVARYLQDNSATPISLLARL